MLAGAGLALTLGGCPLEGSPTTVNPPIGSPWITIYVEGGDQTVTVNQNSEDNSAPEPPIQDGGIDTDDDIEGRALRFNTPFANGDVVKVPGDVFDGLLDFTVEMWVNITEAEPGPADVTNTFISLAQTGDDNYWALFQTAHGQIQAHFLGASYLQLGSLPTLNQWTHIAVTRQGGSMTLYLNGLPQQTVSVSAQPLAVPSNGAFLGHDQDCVGGCFNEPEQAFSGVMDEVRVWNRSLSQSDIVARMHSVLTEDETGLLAYWRFYELDGQELADSSGNGHIATLGASNGVDDLDPVRVQSSVP